ncbi:MAG: hypothetical protein KDB14_07780 [Planctomycetales bacterium]|nr:hypothetical protein [Planctomycetales bacterium]
MRLLILTPTVLVLTALGFEAIHAQDADTNDPEAPRAIVVRWLELHRTGKRDDAAALTTGTPKNRARLLLPFNRDTGVRVEQSLGNKQVAAVVTGALKETRDGEQVLLFWLIHRDGSWRIDKSDSIEKRVADERLRGFMEAGDVRWHVQRDQLAGDWVAGPCTPPGFSGIACGCDLQLNYDSRYRLLPYGPGGPDPQSVMRGKWRVADGKFVLSHQDRTFECIVIWASADQFEIESADGKFHVRYDRTTEPRELDIKEE